MTAIRTVAGITIRLFIISLNVTIIFNCTACQNAHPDLKRGLVSSQIYDSTKTSGTPEEYMAANTMLVLPKNPAPGEPFRILATGGEKIRKAEIVVSGPSANIHSSKSKTGEIFPYWQIDDFPGSSTGKYRAALIEDKREVSSLEFTVSPAEMTLPTGIVWKSIHGWDSGMENLYSAWINSLFYGSDEQASWSALHEVLRDQNQNFLYNYLSYGEDDPNGKNSLIMQPDCADNPFFLRAYFAWKLGLPFGYHVCDRGSLFRNPQSGQWITNESSIQKTHPVLAFNSFLRKIKDGVHSGTARTALDDENSDYYPVSLERGALRPGTVYADPYGHTLILVSRIPQKPDKPGLLLSVDAQPDGTVGIKRFWKGNFLFNTSGVIGEPGFKAFRPISINKGILYLMHNKELTSASGFVPFSLQQRKMKNDVFYHTMERLINPKPLDPETELLDLIQALYEQLLVRVTSVANAEAWFKLHPGAVIPMPSNAAGVFQAGGQWEDFSTPNRDLRILIALDAVTDFPDLVANSPSDFNLSGKSSPEQIKKRLESILDLKISELLVNYIRTDGSMQKLTVAEIIRRRDAFEMGYNPNDGAEIRWGAPENSGERATCRRHAPSNQLEKMRSIQTWFSKRLHPPT